MHDAPPPYPGINPSYTPSYPTQPNGFNGQQPPQMGFAGAPAAGGSAPPPSYPGGSSGFVPQAPGSSYPNLPHNGFNGGFQQPGASAPPSSENFLPFQTFSKLNKFLLFSDKRTGSSFFRILRPTTTQFCLRPTASVL